MVLASQIVSVDFAQGLDQKTDRRHVVSGKLLDAANVRFDKNGALQKRFGHVYLGSLLSDCVRLFSFRNEVLVVDDNAFARSWSPAANAMSERGIAMDCVATREGLAANMAAMSAPDVAYGNGVLVAVWTDGADATTGGQIYMSIVDVTTGTELVSSKALTFSIFSAVFFTPRVCYVPTTKTFVIAYHDAASSIVVRTVGSTFAVGGEVTLIADNRAGGDFEIAPLPDRWGLIYQTTAGTDPQIIVYDSLLNTLATLSINNNTAVAKGGFGLVATAGESIWASWSYTSAGTHLTKVTCIDAVTGAERAGFPLTAFSSATDKGITSGIARVSATAAIVAISASTTLGECVMAPRITTAAAITTTAAHMRTYWCQLASKPFTTSSGRVHAWVYAGGTRYAAPTPPEAYSYSLQLLDLQGDNETTTQQGRPVTGPVAPRFSKPEAAIPVAPPSSVAGPVGQLYEMVARVLKSNDGRVGLTRVRADFGHANRMAPAELGDTVHLVPGSYYDGQHSTASQSFREIGFAYGPEEVVLTAGGASSGNMAAGDYWYVAVYEWIDARGNVHRSAPSAPRKATAAALGSVAVNIPALTITARHEGASLPTVGLVLYRTTVGGNSSGPFYRLATAPMNDTGSESITVADSAADTSTGFVLAARPTLYTTGGVLVNVQPPSCSSIVAHKGRIWLVADDGRTVWYSKAVVEGDAIAFCDEFTLPVEDALKITALASLDGALVIFTRTKIYVLSGTEGPNDLGNNSDIGSPQPLASDLGCIEPRSVVLTPLGLMFQSDAGIYLLSRALEVTFAGQSVADLLLTYPTITSAIVHPRENVVLFTAVGTSTGVRIAFDYRVGQWSYDEMRGTLAPGAGVMLAGQCVSNGVLHVASSFGTVMREAFDGDATAHLDEVTSGVHSWVYWRAELANIALGGIAGYQRAIRLLLQLEKFTSHDLRVEVANDFANVVHQARTWSAVQLNSMPLEQVRLHLTKQRCQAVRARISDAPPTGGPGIGAGRGFSAKGLALEVGILPKAARLAAAQKG